jgi:hypothetical protein
LTEEEVLPPSFALFTTRSAGFGIWTDGEEPIADTLMALPLIVGA